MNIRNFLVIVMAFSSVCLSDAFGLSVERINELGMEATAEGDYKKAFGIYKNLEGVSVSRSNAPDLAKGLMCGGNVSLMTADYEGAIKFYKQALRVAEDYGMASLSEKNMNNIGCLYAMLEHYSTAMFFFEQAINSALARGDDDVLGIAAVNATMAQCNLGNVERALYYLDLQKKYPVADQRTRDFNLVFNDASVHMAGKQWKQAIAGFYKSMEVSEKSPADMSMRLRCHQSLGRAYQMINCPDSAIRHYKAALNIGTGGNLYALRDILGGLVSSYKQVGDDVECGRYLDDYVMISDSIIGLKQFDALDADLRHYEYDRKMFQLGQRDAMISDRNRFIVVICVCLLLAFSVIVITIVHHKKLKRAYVLLVRKNEEIISESENHSQAERELIETNMRLNSIIEELRNGVGKESSESTDKTPCAITDSQSRILYQKILETMEDERFICNPDFNISDLARAVNSNTKYVSSVINSLCKCNFKTFINEYRIRMVCKRLSDIDGYGKFTLEALSQEVGFKSPSTLWVVFKKFTGMTPAVYQRIQKDNSKSDT